MPLNPKYEPTEAELLATVQRMEEATRLANEAMLAMEPSKPWAAVARLTARTEPSARVWSRANESRIACAKAGAKHWQEIRRAGLWPDALRYYRKRWQVTFAISRLYLAAFLHTFCVLGALDLRKDQELLAAWCQ